MNWHPQLVAVTKLCQHLSYSHGLKQTTNTVYIVYYYTVSQTGSSVVAERCFMSLSISLCHSRSLRSFEVSVRHMQVPSILLHDHAHRCTGPVAVTCACTCDQVLVAKRILVGFKTIGLYAMIVICAVIHKNASLDIRS